MDAKKRIRIFDSFEDLERHEVRENIKMSLQERWEAFWEMRKNHKMIFPVESSVVEKNLTGKKRLIVSKPTWI